MQTLELVEALGEIEVAFMVGIGGPELDGWLSGDRPPEGSADRLAAAGQAWRVLSRIHPPELARAWFGGTNPRLDGRTPLQAIRDGDLGPVLVAAVAFVKGPQP